MESLARSGSILRLLAGLILRCGSVPDDQAAAVSEAPLTDRERALLDRIDNLEKRVATLEGKSSTAPEGPRTTDIAAVPADAAGIIGDPGTGTKARRANPYFRHLCNLVALRQGHHRRRV